MMLDQPSLALIEEHVRQLLGIMGFTQVRVHCSINEDGLCIALEAGEASRILIGTSGAHLIALQHIIRCLLRRHLPNNEYYVRVDVNGYRSRREQTLSSLAEAVARKTQHTGRTVVLRPMPAADRRTIHTALAHRKDVRTESLGDEPNRRVVVRPIFL
jgi:spoIIIJ-associated protein